MDKQVQNLMRSLKISEAEARELIAYDNKVDKAKAKDKLEFDLSAEQEKETRKWRQAERKPTVYDFSKRERKPNILKGEIIQALFNFLNENSELGIENCIISNKERMICFESSGEKLDLTLIQKRKPKEKSE